MFNGASSIEEINFLNIDTSKVTSMTHMFYNCSSLLSLDLSNFVTTSATSIRFMFSYCTSLQFLDISHFNTIKCYWGNGEGIFRGLIGLKYLNLFYIQDNYNILGSNYVDLASAPGLIVCKRGITQIFGMFNINLFNLCDDEYFSYPAINYVTITYGQIKYRKRSLVSKTKKYFMIGSGNKIEFHFGYKLTKNENIFSCSSIPFYDKENITSFDFSHFDSSKMTNMESMFHGCDSLNSINFTNFNTSSATDMSNMFQGCIKLKSLNLSGFNTSSVKKMDYMFNNMTSLTFLNLTNFDTSSVTDMNYMFSDSKSLNNLQYIDISNMTENELIKEKLSSLNSNTDLLICIKMCYTNNYITVQFGEKTKYDGFGSDYRDGVIYIKYNDTLYLKNESFTIEQNDTIEIHFGYPVTSLVAFFGYESNSDSGDKNVENIVSIDLSNFNSSLIDDISAMFQGCT